LSYYGKFSGAIVKPPVVLDVFEFARAGQALEGEAPIAAFPRLESSVAGAGSPVRWRATGSIERISGLRDVPVLRIEAGALVQLACQRCLEKMDHPLQVKSRLEIVEDPEAAENADLEDEEADVVLGSTRFNLLWQVEEELLLGLPFTPRHDVCPSVQPGAEEAARRPSPFAVLESLKKKT
jgi:uncharacterized protein